MKRITLAAALMLSVTAAKADEGMWTLYDLPNAVYEQMQAEGFTMPYDGLYNNSNAIKNCVVNFSGYCSGVVVSPDGLVFTNHHCGFEAIRSHSTVEHDYMLNGFYAKSYADELPNKDMFVSFMIEQKDITSKLDSMGINTMLPSRQEAFLDSVENAWSKDVKANDSTLRLEIKPFYEGNKYYATTYRDFTDLRLVFTIPKSMGKYGGETDNWMWPRQTCDFSVFRIYADPKTNGPAEYSENNVPYHPSSWAPVSMEGYKDGDFSMTIGYPGSTSRYLSSYGIRQRRDAINEPRAQVRGVKQDVMIRHMRADEAVRIKYDSKYAQSSNYWKNSIGMNKCIDSTELIRHKADFEAKIRRYQDSTGYLKGKLDFDLMSRLYDKRIAVRRAMTVFTETFFRTNELASRALRAHNGSEVKGPENKKSKQYIEFADNSAEWDEALDKEVYAVLLKNYREQVDAKYLPDFYKTIDSRFGGDYARYVDYLYANSMLMKSGKKIYINKKSFNKDLGVQMGLDIMSMYATLGEPLTASVDSIDVQERYLCAAKIRMEEDMPHYSDANFTMRLSYGQVGGFMLNGKPSGYYTTAESIVDKMNKGDKVIDYFAEPIMKTLFSAKNFDPYTDKTTGKMQLCFLTNNDITGGNSGSPMFNGKGELIGLAFDGNWDSLSGDIFFDSKLARCIGVDIRYVLFMMDRWGHADRLLKEINAK
ncbi:MAG: S46 family peptidase [Prevotella sp.]|nr:S46 family peptidase [Prevotella sp.]